MSQGLVREQRDTWGPWEVTALVRKLPSHGIPFLNYNSLPVML